MKELGLDSVLEAIEDHKNHNMTNMVYIFGDRTDTYVTTDGLETEHIDSNGKSAIDVYRQQQLNKRDELTCQNKAYGIMQ